MLINRISKALCVMLLSWQPMAMALPSDANKAIHITADSATRNDQTGITLYKGDVLLTQGSLKVSGDSIELRQTGNTITMIIARGRPAEFQQRSSADQEITHAYGEVLDYNLHTKELEITGQAKVTQGSDLFSGNRIVYNMNKSTVNAFRDENADGERVQIVIQPKATPTTEPTPAPGELQPQ
ncbi:lipopolysaccharide transport periplasmic protein LptA [Amphritea sp. 1_MG-2023]|uniref:lipopolysaccharide transport periplasmic protein LptA n=1 Tax=Amphritea sp. 1_MG-2023 TaxID=3062670 RepID=UPI0026E3B650|nr:lipopolysaccharide transport periplasmic protein LptA [Amphritea sp. 1_MG-2023]MDO6564063.1 lipopolysaccharide transport periplasmic protein LptA [Amphritea sp. 1_MG-2023]